MIISSTEPGPYDHKAIAGPGRFLVGAQGYGAFSSTLYDRHGRPVQTWPSHGMMLIDQQGTIRGPESENTSSGRSRFRVLSPDGSMRDGPRLTGYHTTYPALDAEGTAVFWRDGALLTVDADLHQHELFTMTDDRAVMSRILLLEHGTVAFALDNELLIFRDTGLTRLADGPWPCAGGNIRGNPAVSVRYPAPCARPRRSSGECPDKPPSSAYAPVCERRPHEPGKRSADPLGADPSRRRRYRP
jgi:hypothetical protein